LEYEEEILREADRRMIMVYYFWMDGTGKKQQTREEGWAATPSCGEHEAAREKFF
jgi:hypothetical protein